MSLALTSSIPGADPSWHRRGDHPYFKPSHHKLQRFVRQYVDENIRPNVDEWERNGEIPEAVSRLGVSHTPKYLTDEPQSFKKHASMGFLAASAFPLPRDYLNGVTLPARLSIDGRFSMILG